MKAAALVRFGPDRVLRRVHCEPPLVVRADRDGVAWLVGAAGGPIGGDELTFEIDVEDGGDAAIRSAAAQIVLPGTGRSRSTVRVTIGAEAALDWAPEPTVITERADHVVQQTVALATTSRLRWREEIVLGRHGEHGGRLASRLRVTVDGRPIVHHELSLHPASIGDHRAVVTELLAGPDVAALDIGPAAITGAARLPASGSAVLHVALGRTLDEARERLGRTTPDPAQAGRATPARGR